MNRTILFKGNELHLFGRDLQLGQEVPHFRAVSGEMKEVRLDDFSGKIKIITSFPSLDTPVCNKQLIVLNERAKGLSDEMVILAISQDLPFAQKRFCETYRTDHVLLLSDYQFSSFGINYGILIKELKLLARGIFLVDKDNMLRYREIVEELTQEPHYEEAFSALKKVEANPHLTETPRVQGRCLPCEGGTPALAPEEINRFLGRASGWSLVEGPKIVKDFKFKDDLDAKDFVNGIAVVANEQNHHSHIALVYNKVRVTLWTHAINGLSHNDILLAGMIDELSG